MASGSLKFITFILYDFVEGSEETNILIHGPKVFQNASQAFRKIRFDNILICIWILNRDINAFATF